MHRFDWRVYLERALGMWRGSLQLRTVALTLLLSVLAVTAVGGYIVTSVRANLFDQNREQVVEEAGRAIVAAQRQFTQADESGATDDLEAVQRAAFSAMSAIISSGPLVAMVRSPDDSDQPPVLDDRLSEGFSEDQFVSPQLRDAIVDADEDVAAWQSIALPADGAEDPGIIVGSLLRVPQGQEYELYIVYNLRDVQETLDFVQSSLALAGAALVLLIGGVAYLVVRLVVGPVRVAAEASEKLAAGELQSRLPEGGEDELSTLARSFNRMADSLQRQIRQLADLSRVQQRFVSDVSHELRTPLTTIRLAGDVLYDQREAFPPATARTAELLHAQTQRFETLLADLLEMSRYDAGAVQLELEPTNLVRLVEDAIEAVEPIAAEKGTEIRVFAPGGHFEADVDARRIRRILQNLLGNAIDHGESRPIDVYVDSDADAVAIAVRDHGIGMASADLEHVFDRFWRADPSRQRSTGGTGLGLAIALEDAAVHGGVLEVWSEESLQLLPSHPPAPPRPRIPRLPPRTPARGGGLVMRLRALVPALLALALLGGCVAIPTSGAVQIAPLDTDPDEAPPIARPPGPEPGQDRFEILQGFIRAGRAPQNGYAVAEQYLAPETQWSGTARVLISSSAIQPTEVDEDTLAISLTIDGEVDQTGRYSAIPSQQLTLTYDFTTVDGEVRISRADPGSVLTLSRFNTAFAAYPLYFFDPSFDYLVPDLRWFPETRLVADRIVTELLASPAPWLGSGVLVSAFPPGTTGEADYDAPEVLVELSPEVRSESGETQRRMLQQLESSLGALGNVAVRADGLALSPAPEGTPPESSYQVRDVAIGGVGGKFGTLVADGVAELSAIRDRADELLPVAASLSRQRDAAAILGPAGVSLVGSAFDQPVLIDDRPGLVPPTLDPHGYVWTVPAGDPGGLFATSADRVPHPMSLPAEGSIVTIEVSRDGARLLVAVAASGGPRVFVVGIQRNADLAPVAFGAPFEVPVTGQVLDAAWVDGERIAVLRSGASGPRVDVVPLGGPVVDLGEVAGGIAIVGGNFTEGLRVLSSDGSVLRPSSAGGWVATDLVASFLGTQQ